MDLKEYFEVNNKAAIAFSGGVDSSYLLWAAVQAGADVTAYYARSQFQPEFEYSDAVMIAEMAGAAMRVLDLDVLADETVRSNPPDRCYYCKTRIMSAILAAAGEDGYDIVLDGTNASDDPGDRPGTRALREAGVRSPLRECGLTKNRIRELSREAGLPVWNKPAYACLATRIPAGEEITADKLVRTEKAEDALRAMGFRDFRVRLRDGAALVQISEDQHSEALERAGEITDAIGCMYDGVRIDAEPRPNSNINII